MSDSVSVFASLPRGLRAARLGAALLCAALAVSACQRSGTEAAGEGAAAKVYSGRIAQFQTIDQQVGTGAVAQPGQTVIVHYTGWLYDEKAADKHGTQFDSSLTRGRPFEFLLGAGRVIRGWDDGVAGMRVGGKRVLMVPPDMGYGAAGAGGGVIPPDTSLVFEVELLGVEQR